MEKETFYERHKSAVNGFILGIIILCIIGLICIGFGNRIERQRDTTTYEGMVTEVTFDGDILVVEFDNRTVARMKIGSIQDSMPLSIELWKHYEFTVSGYNYLTDYRQIEGVGER